MESREKGAARASEHEDAGDEVAIEEKEIAGPRVGGALRCPFCRASVEPATQEWVACESCLARHHATCWREHGACSSCGGTKRIAPAEARRRPSPARAALFAVLAALVGMSTVFASVKLASFESRLAALEHRASGDAPEADLARAKLIEEEALAQAHAASISYKEACAPHWDAVHKGDADSTPAEIAAARAAYVNARFESGRKLLDLAASFERAGKTDEAARVRKVATDASEGRAASVFAERAREAEEEGRQILHRLSGGVSEDEHDRSIAYRQLRRAFDFLVTGEAPAADQKRLRAAVEALENKEKSARVLELLGPERSPAR